MVEEPVVEETVVEEPIVEEPVVEEPINFTVNPKTGDESSVVIYAVIALLALTTLVVVNRKFNN